MKNSKAPSATQVAALIAVLAAALLFAYGISLIPSAPRAEAVEADPELRALVEDVHGLEPGNSLIMVERQEGNYYLLSIHLNQGTEGGGFLSVAKRGGDMLVSVESGQFCAPSCDRLAAYDVPTSLIPYCEEEDADPFTLTDRRNGKIIEEAPSYLCL